MTAMAAQRLAQTQEQTLRQEQQKDGIIVKRGRDEERGSVRLAKLVHDAGYLAEEKRKLEKDLGELRTDILEEVEHLLQDVGTLHLITPDGVYKTSIKVRDTVELEDVEGLEVYLGDNLFDELVETVTTYKPTAELRERALAGERADAKKLREHLVVKRCSPTVTHQKPSKPQED